MPFFLKNLCGLLVLSISLSSFAGPECLNVYVDLPPEVKAELDKQTALAKSLASKSNFIRITDHDSRVKEVIYKSTRAIPVIEPDGISYEIKHNFLNRTDGEAVSVVAKLVDWMQASDSSIAQGVLKMKWTQVKETADSVSKNLGFMKTRFWEFLGRGKSNTTSLPGIDVVSDSQTSESYRIKILSAVSNFDLKMQTLGFQIPTMTRIYIQESKANYGAKQITAEDLKLQDKTRPDDHTQYIQIDNRAKEKVGPNEVLRERALAVLKTNFNRDGVLLKEENSFLSKDPTLSNAIADFLAAHQTGIPTFNERNIELGQLSSQVKVENVKDLSRVGGTANSLLISKILWDYRVKVGADKVDLILPRLLRNLSVLRSSFESTELFALSPGEEPYRYHRGSSFDRASSLQFEVDNLKFFLASMLLAHDETPGDNSAGKAFIQERLKFLGFKSSSSAVRDRGVISGKSGMTANLVPLIAPGEEGKYPRLPKAPVAVTPPTPVANP